MLQLIRSHKTVMAAPRSVPLPHTTSTTAPAEMDFRPANSFGLVDSVGPRVSHAPVSSAFLVALPVSARRGHRHPRMPDMTSISTTDVSGS
ncbi:hypothetical protein C1H46_012033 [Malus baccata]|uniref:Uncharacterized protein n=1 Tax=Malus baccata TaxID=106549 RepID=A0A540MUC0_MALBA|nr:hypothetical protein C1H46_012033 [Malus baccata]